MVKLNPADGEIGRGTLGSVRRAAIVGPVSAGLGAHQVSQPPDETFGTRPQGASFLVWSLPNRRRVHIPAR